MKATAIIIFSIGVLFSIYSGVNLVTKEKVVDVGSIEITKDKNNYISWSPLVGFGIMVLGAGVFLFGTEESQEI